MKQYLDISSNFSFSLLLGVVFTFRDGISLDHRLKGLTSHWMTDSDLLMLMIIFFSIYFISLLFLNPQVYNSSSTTKAIG